MNYKKDKVLQVRVGERDFKEIQEMSNELQLNTSDFIRYCIMFYSVHKKNGLYNIDKNI